MAPSNWETDPARRYHERTKHTFASVRAGRHYLDWDNRPHPFKEYVGVEPVPLPKGNLGRVLRWGAGVVRTRRIPGGDVYHFRTYSSAGALYPVEVYLASADLPDLPGGLYHFHPRDLALRRLRAGDVRGSLAASADAEDLAEAEAVLVLTGILWRTAWKYQARGYRHLYWDAGTMLANVLALAAADRAEARLLTGFVDDEVNRLVGVDGESEAALALVAVGRATGEPPPPRPVEPLDLAVAPLSGRRVEYPDAGELHASSKLGDREEVQRYRRDSGAEAEKAALPTAGAPLDDVIRRRGSVRDFARDAVPAAELAGILAAAAGPVPADVLPPAETYLVANAVDGLSPGAYRFDEPDGFTLLRSGDFRRQAAYLCLEQPLGGLAAATHFLLADLERTLAAHGNRGYRAAQLEAGIRAGRMYLGAVARGMAATASTFYDDDVTRFFGADEKETMVALATGRPA
ncbi:MAG TPA: SagB/ThcOx family dehydrogenase [Gaiellaceae bacterium]|nr:SagB/ThcOx family dehydrogenase [Gaiellaceae bacterium]